MAVTGMTLAQMRAAVLSEGGFDEANETVDRWLNMAHRELVAGALWRKAVVSLGVTVADQAEYDLDPSIVDLAWVRVGGTRYDPSTIDVIGDVVSGVRVAYGRGGLFAPSYSATGDSESIMLYPTPETAGVAIDGLAALFPDDLVNDGDSPQVPVDFHEAIVGKAIGTGLKRVDERPDTGAVYDAEFENKKQELFGRRNSRVGSGPTRIRVGR